jgi:hypothetical protein
LQDRYEAAGMDPSFALNQDDLNDFGGPQAFTGFN